MEKRDQKSEMDSRNRLRKVVISGPESSGKSELAKVLATEFKSVWIPEYARTYVEQLDRPYTFHDVELIAKVQVAMEDEFRQKAKNNILIFDTWLVITKVWFDVVYGHCPQWIIDHIQSAHIDLFLVCDTDLPWIPDGVRENGGQMRENLFRLYCEELMAFGFTYEIVSGLGEERLHNALAILKRHDIIPV